jgi:hypothetical protein
MTHRSIFETIINKIRELLQSDEFLDAHRVEKHFIRKRLLSMYQVVLFLIYTTKQKMDTNIDNIRIDLPNIKFPNISKQALSKARQGIKPSLFESFFDLTADIFYSNRNRTNLWMEKFHLYNPSFCERHQCGYETDGFRKSMFLKFLPFCYYLCYKTDTLQNTWW